MARTIHLNSSCHCGAVRQEIHTLSSDSRTHNHRATEDLTQEVYLCHCVACQKMSGGLWGSYFPCKEPLSLEGLVGYGFRQLEHGSLEGEKRWFCGKCGCHIFRWTGRHREEGLGGEENEEGEDREGRWEVATGVLNSVEGIDVVRFVGHTNVSQPGDGGAAVWLQELSDGQDTVYFGGEGPDYYTGKSSDKLDIGRFEHYLRKQVDASDVVFPEKEADTEDGRDLLNACCLCQKVSFHITRPDASSRLPRSNMADLLIAYHTQDPRIKNPENEKWWLRGAKGAETKYLAGTCACRSCRLVSGFEIQPWAFVPRSNIYFHVKSEDGEKVEVPLDFENEVFRGVLQSYESSDGVLREFCGTCGATVFWHDKWRPDVIDVSVGLLDAPEGTRAENWLDWWTERVSFEEDAVDHGRKLVTALGKGIAAWGEPFKGTSVNLISGGVADASVASPT